MTVLTPTTLPGLLSTGDLASMRTVMDTSLPDTGVVWRRTLADDGQGGRTQTYSAVGTVACRLSPVSALSAGSEEVHGDRQTAIADRIITFPANTDVVPTDRIVVSDQTFEVLAIHAPRSWEISTRVDCVEVD